MSCLRKRDIDHQQKGGWKGVYGICCLIGTRPINTTLYDGQQSGGVSCWPLATRALVFKCSSFSLLDSSSSILFYLFRNRVKRMNKRWQLEETVQTIPVRFWHWTCKHKLFLYQTSSSSSSSRAVTVRLRQWSDVTHGTSCLSSVT